jgi:DNA-binding response OmpR family regulator
MQFVILYAGRDPQLLRQWSKPLLMAGYNVVPVVDPVDTVYKLFNGDFDLVLLCESLPVDDRRRLARLVRNHSPSTPVLIINEQEGVDYDMGTRGVLGNAEKILAAVQTSLN